MRSFLLLALAALVALASAQHPQPPRFPAQAWYSLVGDVDENGGRLAGTHYHDRELGFVRWDQSYIDASGVEELLEIAIWDLNANKVTYMTPASETSPVICMIAPTQEGFAPSAPDFSSWKFSAFDFDGPKMIEKWVDANGGIMEVEAFSRLPIAMINTTSFGGDHTDIEWSDSVPNAEVFMVPSTLPCTMSNETVMANANHYSPWTTNRRAFGLTCSICKFLIGKIVGKGCSLAARGLCLLTAEFAPVCGIILSIICQGACTGAACAQKICHTIRIC